jgi:hypothetical protein
MAMSVVGSGLCKRREPFCMDGRKYLEWVFAKDLSHARAWTPGKYSRLEDQQLPHKVI